MNFCVDQINSAIPDDDWSFGDSKSSDDEPETEKKEEHEEDAAIHDSGRDSFHSETSRNPSGGTVVIFKHEFFARFFKY